MTGYLITLALAALAIWLLVDSAVEFIRDSKEDELAGSSSFESATQQ